MLYVNCSISMLNWGGMCPIVYGGGATVRYIKLWREFQSEPELLSCKSAKFDDSIHFRNLDFATTSYGCSIPKLGRKLFETTSNKIHMLTFLKNS